MILDVPVLCSESGKLKSINIVEYNVPSLYAITQKLTESFFKQYILPFSSMISHKRDIFDAVVVVVVKTVNYTLISDVYVDETFLSLPQQKLDQNFIQFLLSIHLGVDIK